MLRLKQLRRAHLLARKLDPCHASYSLINSNRYNVQSHPLPFMKASQVFAPKQQAKDRPDIEEAIEESDEGEAVEPVEKDDEENDLSKDKYIKAPKKKAASKAAASTSGKGKKRAVESDVEDSEPKKAKSTKGRAKK